jgi:hypothetical protein
MAKPEPNKYTDLGWRNLRDSVAIYATIDEINSFDICSLLKRFTRTARFLGVAPLFATSKGTISGLCPEITM